MGIEHDRRMKRTRTLCKDSSVVVSSHYANMPMQNIVIFYGCKNVNFQMKNCDIFLIFGQNIDCWYSLEPPQ